jgi:hypothetical protein
VVLQVVDLCGEERRCGDKEATREPIDMLANLSKKTSKRGFGRCRFRGELVEKAVPSGRRWRSSRGVRSYKLVMSVVQGPYRMDSSRVHSREERASHDAEAGFDGLGVHGYEDVHWEPVGASGSPRAYMNAVVIMNVVGSLDVVVSTPTVSRA